VAENTELFAFLLAKVKGKSRNAIKSIMSRGQVSVGGDTVTLYNHPLKAGQIVEINWGHVSMKTQFQGMNIVFEDEYIIVIDKEAGLLSVGTDKERIKTAYHILKDHVKSSSAANKIFIVHRLDRGTSGLMVFARDIESRDAMQNNWQETVTDRKYVAVVEGIMEQQSGTVKSWLRENKAMNVYSSNIPNDGLLAITHFKVLKSRNNLSLVELNLETGRKNQIRVHMKDLGHPILGDRKYGSTKNPLKRLALHAKILAFRHPVTGKELRFESPTPGKFTRF
jgi:23S rRNA pseudouridine1911/1915/1917 synthase